MADSVIDDGTTTANITTGKGVDPHQGKAYVQARVQLLDYTSFTDDELKAVFQ